MHFFIAGEGLIGLCMFLFQYGILIGIGISLLILLYPIARPNMTVSLLDQEWRISSLC